MSTRTPSKDDGFSMIEVTVVMAIMSVMLAMFLSSTVQMFRTANKTEAIATAQSQISIAFQRLDREIRYAEGISTPSTSAPWYVEYVTAHTGTAVCTQLWLDTGSRQLRHRTWNQGSTTVRTKVVLASGVTATQPFTVYAPDTVYNVQRLRVRLTATSGQGTSGSTQNVDVTFTAMNTTLSTSSSTVCTEARAWSW